MTTIGLALTIRRVNDRVRPQPHSIPLAVAAGAAWPLVILGAAEMAAVAIVVEAARRRTSRFPTRATPRPTVRAGLIIPTGSAYDVEPRHRRCRWIHQLMQVTGKCHGMTFC